jgi:C1A family cysteine protease
MEGERAATLARLTDRRGGWLPDYPDHRDYTFETPLVASVLERTAVGRAPATLPERVDLRAWCSPVEYQGPINSCTANAACGLVEYFERRTFGQHVDVSRLFLYKVTRNLLGWRGDTGAHLRTTMTALEKFGTPPEAVWPYVVWWFDLDPPEWCYRLAAARQALLYYRLDSFGASPQQLLDRVKAHLAAELPAMFGFTSFVTMLRSDLRGRVPFPATGEPFFQTHAVVAVGYDDELEVHNPLPGGASTTGALLIRNSWGRFWGEDGYGWLPYEYVLQGMAADFWVLIRSELVPGPANRGPAPDDGTGLTT